MIAVGGNRAFYELMSLEPAFYLACMNKTPSLEVNLSIDLMSPAWFATL